MYRARLSRKTGIHLFAARSGAIYGGSVALPDKDIEAFKGPFPNNPGRFSR
jgi:hypothetical protein